MMLNDIPMASQIMAEVPANPFVIDIMGKAIELAYAHYDRAEYDSIMKVLPEVVKYATETSAQGYFKYYLPIGLLLAGVPANQWAELETASGTVTKTVEALKSFIHATGWKKKFLALYTATNADVDYLFVIMTLLLHHAETAVEDENITDILGLAYIEVSLRKSALDGQLNNNRIFPVYNKFMSLLLNKAEF